MSVKALNHVWQKSKQKGAPLLVLLAIADSANDDGFCWLGMTKLAKKVRQTPNNTRWNIQKIEHDGEIIVYERKREDDPSMNHSNLYKLVMPETSEEMPPDLKGKLSRREARIPRTRKSKSTPNIGSTTQSILVVSPSQNGEADPLLDPPFIQDQSFAPNGDPDPSSSKEGTAPSETPAQANARNSISAPRKVSEWQVLVGLCMDTWACERGKATKIAQMLGGKAKGDSAWAASKLDTPTNEREFKGWMHWVKRSKRELPLAAWQIQESFTAFRKSMAYEDAIRDANDPPPAPEPTPEVDPAVAAASRARKDAMIAELIARKHAAAKVVTDGQ